MKFKFFPLIALCSASDLPEGYTPQTLPSRAVTGGPSQLFFDTVTDSSKWVALSSDKFTGEWKANPRKFVSVEGDLGLQMTTPSAYHGLASPLSRTWAGKSDLFFTMEVQQEDVVNCGGSYVKLFDTSLTKKSVADFDENTPYSIMFGPDQCGRSSKKVHFIIKWQKDGEFIEAHLAEPPKPSEKSNAHQYGFAISRENGLKIFLDGEVVLENKQIAELFRPHDFEAPKEIPDETDSKPDNWVDEPEIVDPEASKPSDWPDDEPEEIVDEDAVMPSGWLVDEPEYIVNEEAVKPEDWNDEEDGHWLPPRIRNPACSIGCGEWKRPMKSNPAYKGEWVAPMIENPDYKGPWAPRLIPNPKYWKVEQPFDIIRPINAVGIELWTVEAGSMFDNFYMTTDEKEFTKFIKDTYEYKKDVEAANLKQREDLAEKEMEEKLESETEGHTWSSYLTGSNRTMLIVSLGVPVLTTLFWLRKSMSKRAKGAEKKEEDQVADEGKTAKSVSRKASSASGEEKTPETFGADTSAPTSAKPEDKKDQ